MVKELRRLSKPPSDSFGERLLVMRGERAVVERAKPRPRAFNGISVVIPCLNEEEAIAGVIEAAREGVERVGLPKEIIVVDNCSDDRSAEIAAENGVRVLFEPIRGYGATLRRGMRDARKDILVVADGDATYDLRELADLVQPILDRDADFVVGNRMHNLAPGAMPFLHRYVGNPLLTLVLRVLFQCRNVGDAHCGMRTITKDAYEKLGCVTTGMEFASEMIVRAIDQKLLIKEREIVYHPRVGESKLNSFSDGWRHLRFMVLNSPTVTLLIPGALAWIVGMLVAVPLAFGPIELDGRKIDIHFMLMSGLLNIMSLQILSAGFVAKVSAHISGLRLDPVVERVREHVTFERAVGLSSLFVVSGSLVIGAVVWKWLASGMGALDMGRPLFLGIMLLTNGVQIAVTGYVLGIIGIAHDNETASGAECSAERTTDDAH